MVLRWYCICLGNLKEESNYDEGKIEFVDLWNESIVFL